MKLPASDQTSKWGRKPHIKKGFYPMQLLRVRPFADRNGNLIEKKYGYQLILEFAVYKPDDNGKPIELMKYKDESDEIKPVILPSFIYHQYINKKTGDVHTAITPNSRITKLLVVLGWEFTTEGIDLDNYIGKWVEGTIDDYEQKDGDETYTASTIKDIKSYKGEEPNFQLEKPEIPGNKEVKKQLNHETVKKKTEELSIEEKKKNIRQQFIDGKITQSGYNQALEQLESLEKK